MDSHQSNLVVLILIEIRVFSKLCQFIKIFSCLGLVLVNGYQTKNHEQPPFTLFLAYTVIQYQIQYNYTIHYYRKTFRMINK